MWLEVREQRADALPCCFDRSGFGFSQEGFELCEDLFDGVQVWAVGRQEQEFRAGLADGLAHGLAFVAAQVVHDDDVASRERRYEELLDISGEELAVDRSVDHARCVDPVATQGGKEGERAPFAERRFGMEPFAASGATMGAGHVGFSPGLVDEDEAPGIKPALIFAPLCSPSGDLRTILLAGDQAFF